MGRLCRVLQEQSPIVAICKYGHLCGRSPSGSCRECTVVSMTRYRATKKGHAMALSAQKNYRKRNLEKVLEYDKGYKDKNKEKMVAYRRKRTLARYGITEQDYERMYIAQNGCCAICGKHSSTFKKRLSVDHNHKTGQVRGLLCYRCNKFVVGRHTLESATKLLNYLKVEAQ